MTLHFYKLIAWVCVGSKFCYNTYDIAIFIGTIQIIDRVKMLQNRDQQLARKDEQLAKQGKQIKKQKKEIKKVKPKKVVKKVQQQKKPLPDKLQFNLIQELPKAVNVPKLEEDEAAFDGIARSMKIEILNKRDPEVQLDRLQPAIENKIDKVSRVLGAVKLNGAIQIKFIKMEPKVEQTTATFVSQPPEIVINGQNINEALDRIKAKLLYKIDQWTSEGSAWQ